MPPPLSIPESHDEDASLVRAIQAGDLQAFEPLVERHLDSLHAYVSLRLALPHLIDEITHETFVFAFHHIAEFKAGTSFQAWLRALALNRLRTEFQRYARENRNRLAYAECRALEASLADAGDAAPRELEALDDCLNRLPGHARDLVRLRYQDEASAEQIAGRMDRSLAWVRTTLFRIRQQLRECIERKLRGQPS